MWRWISALTDLTMTLNVHTDYKNLKIAPQSALS